MQKIIAAALGCVVLFAVSVAHAACAPPAASGSPFSPNFSTRLDTMTSESVRITGGCIDGTPIGQNTRSAGDFSILTINGQPIKGVAAIGWVAGANPDKAIIFTAAQSMTIIDIRGTVETAVGAAATLSIYKTGSGSACSSGTNLINSSGTFDANGMASTNQNLTLAGSGAPSMSAGDRVCLSTGNGANFTAGSGIGGITVTYTVP